MKSKRFFGMSWITISIIILVVFLAVTISTMVYVYQQAMENKRMNMDETVSTILEQTSIKEVKEIDIFSGEKSYHVLHAMDESGEEKFIFYPLEGKKKQIHSADISEILSEQDIYSIWKTNCEQCSFIEVNPAIIKDQLLWELIYYDEHERYVLDYFSIYDGTHVEQYRFSGLFE